MNEIFYWRELLAAFLRILSFFAIVPIFNNRGINIKIKIILSLMLTYIIFPVSNYNSWIIPHSLLGLTLVIFEEVIVGFVMGFAVRIVLLPVEIGSEMASYQMAFTFARSVDPTTGANKSVISNFLTLMGIVLFLALNGHYYLVWGITESFRFIPPGVKHIKSISINFVVSFLTEAFELALKIGAPAIGTLLLMDIILSLVGKTAPKIQIFFVGFPLKIAVGLFAVLVILNYSLKSWYPMIKGLEDTFSKIFAMVG